MYLDLPPLKAGSLSGWGRASHASGDPAGWYGFASETRQVAAVINSPLLGAECAARYPGVEAWRCLFGQYRLPLVQTPYMLIQSQYDSYQLTLNLASTYVYVRVHTYIYTIHDLTHLQNCAVWACEPSSDEEKLFATDFASATASLARVLAVGERFIYSSRCQRHAVSLTEEFFLMPGCGSLSLEQALLAFLKQPAKLPTVRACVYVDAYVVCMRRRI